MAGALLGESLEATQLEKSGSFDSDLPSPGHTGLAGQADSLRNQASGL